MNDTEKLIREIQVRMINIINQNKEVKKNENKNNNNI